jgi:hypothetical protein
MQNENIPKYTSDDTLRNQLRSNANDGVTEIGSMIHREEVHQLVDYIFLKILVPTQIQCHGE